MGATGKSTSQSSGAANAVTSKNATQQSQPMYKNANLDDAQAKHMVNELQRLSILNSQNVDNLVGSKDIKERWQNLSDAADRLAKYTQANNALPSLTSGYAADIMFEALPPGSVIDITNAKGDNYNGRYIKGVGNAIGKFSSFINPVVWTRLTDAQGRKLNYDDADRHKIGDDRWLSVANADRTTKLKIVRYGK